MAGQPAEWIDDVSREQALTHTAQIAQWVRLTGTDDERKAFDYIDGVLKGYGLKTRFHEPTCLVSLPESGSLLLDESEPFDCITHAFSTATGDNGVAGELVYAGGGTRAELLAAGAIGKLALTDGLATPQKADAASQVGALGVVCISGDHVHEMIVSPVWGSPTPRSLAALPRVPIVSVTTADGERLRERLQQGPARARVRTEVNTSWRPIPLLVADLDVDDRDYVMFSGHVDSWHYGAMDNGSANATMIETARVLAGHRDELRRGVRFAFWSGHSHARYAGSTWFADHYWFDLRERCVAHVNVDSTGAIGATVLSDANTMADTYGVAADIIQRQTGQQLGYRRFGRAGDQSFWGVGLSSVFMSLSVQGEQNEMSADQAGLLGGGGTAARGGGLGWWWHTTEDTLDKIDPEHLERDVKVYVETVGRFATDPIVPLDLRAGLDEIAGALDEIEPLWAGLPAGGGDDAVGFDALRRDLDDCRAAANAFYASLDEARSDKQRAQRANRALLAASKAIVPVNYTVAGEFEHDPALGATALPALRPQTPVIAMSDDERWGATHQLRRNINRVRAGIRNARQALSATS